jgi:hypothetical protein
MHQQVSLQEFYHKSGAGLQGRDKPQYIAKRGMGVDWTPDGRPRGPTPPHPLPAIPVPQTGFPYYTANRPARPVYSSGRGGLEVGMVPWWQSYQGGSNPSVLAPPPLLFSLFAIYWRQALPCTMIRLCLPICGGTPGKYFYCQDYISPQSACQTNQFDEVRVGFMQQASRWGEHDRGKPYHYYTTCWTSLRSSTNRGPLGSLQQASRWGEDDRGERGEHDRASPNTFQIGRWV